MFFRYYTTILAQIPLNDIFSTFFAKNNFMEIIGQVILRLRAEHNMQQKELGSLLGYSQRTISDWESGRTEPNIDAIKKLVKIFDITYEELLDG